MFSKRKLKNKKNILLVIFSISLLLSMAFSPLLNSGFEFVPAEETIQGKPQTAFQQSLADAYNQRKSAGLPVPIVEFSFVNEIQELHAPYAPTQPPNGGTQFTATTTLYFRGPQEAGYEEWPAVQFSGRFANDDSSSFEIGSLDQIVREGVEEQIPGFWDMVEYGQEHRRYTITETYKESSSENDVLSKAFLQDMNAGEHTEDVLLGFTYTGPHIDYTIKDEAEVCIPFLGCAELYSIKAGFELDWGLGLRLPAEIHMNGSEDVEWGTDTYYETSLNPSDWDADQYVEYGVAAEDGNEFVLRMQFFAGVKISLFGQDLCSYCYVEFDKDYSESFITPFGIGSSFPIPSLDIEIYTLDLEFLEFRLDLTLTPLITSTHIEADWNVSPGNDCIGSGTLVYSEPGDPVTFGPVSVCNFDKDPSTNLVQVNVENFKYYFNQFQIDIGAKVSINVFGVFEASGSKKILELDLSEIFSGLGLYLGDHVQCSADFSCSRKGPDNSVLFTSFAYDATSPVSSIVLDGVAGANDWYISDVQFSLSAEDGCGSGVSELDYSFDNSNWFEYTSPVMVTDEGETTVYFKSSDAAGNQEAVHSKVIRIDKTPPQISGGPTTSPNVFGWWNEDVVVHFDANDDVSGVDFVTPDITISSEGENQTVTGIAVDFAGHTAEFTVNNINIDKTPPIVDILSPLPITYNNVETFTVQWSEADLLAGVYSSSADINGRVVGNGELVDLRLLSAGSYTLTVVVTDRADNQGFAVVDFFVHVDLDGLIASAEYLCELGAISSNGICKSLLAKLENARAAYERGQCIAAKNLLGAFSNELEAQKGKFITDDGADLLSTNAMYVMNGFSCGKELHPVIRSWRIAR